MATRRGPAEVYLDPNWQVLALAGGELLFTHMLGEELLLRRPTQQQRSFATLLSNASRHPFDTSLGRVRLRSKHTSVQTLAKRLLEAGVVKPSGLLIGQDEIPKEEFLRFRSFLAWLGQFTAEPFGLKAYARLRSSTVGIIGMGGAGSLCASMLAASGVGHLKIADGDTVSPSNLVRQLFYTEAQARACTHKVDAVAQYLCGFTSFTRVTTYRTYVQNREDMTKFVFGCNLVIQTGDQPRVILNRLANEACVSMAVPLLHCFVGRVGPLYVPGESACFGCLEMKWRAEGEHYDAMIDALSDIEHVEYPSMVCGPTQVASSLTTEAVGLLSRAYRPRTTEGLIEIDHEGARLVPVPKRLDCPVCSGPAIALA